jgi:hypothetical protein
MTLLPGHSSTGGNPNRYAPTSQDWQGAQGRTCSQCGTWVPNGCTHSCPTGGPFSTIPQTKLAGPFSPEERIATALERIATALEEANRVE